MGFDVALNERMDGRVRLRSIIEHELGLEFRLCCEGAEELEGREITWN